MYYIPFEMTRDAFCDAMLGPDVHSEPRENPVIDGRTANLRFSYKSGHQLNLWIIF
jgi:hypothetical protein